MPAILLLVAAVLFLIAGLRDGIDDEYGDYIAFGLAFFAASQFPFASYATWVGGRYGERR
jgi:hypothetical protein